MLVCLAPEACLSGEGPPPPSRRPGHELPGSARPMWKLHASVQAAEAAGECDEAAEMGSRPRGREGGPHSWQSGLRPQLPRNPVWFADRDWLTRFRLESQTPEGLERGLLPGAAWGEGVRGGEQANLWRGSRSLSDKPAWTSSSPPCYKGTNQVPETLRPCPGSHSKVNWRYPIQPLSASSPRVFLRTLRTPRCHSSRQWDKKALSHIRSPPSCGISV